MAEESKKEPAADAKAAPAKKGAAGTVIGVALTALVATGGAFAGARLGTRSAAAHTTEEAPAAPTVVAVRPPGATVALDAFLVTVSDAAGKQRAIKVTIALELRHGEKEDALKPFVPRIRDATLGYLRALAYEDAADSGHVERMRADMLERFAKLGAFSVEQVLITDFVTQ